MPSYINYLTISALFSQQQKAWVLQPMTCKFTDVNTNSRKFWRRDQIPINFFYELWQMTKPSCYCSRTTMVLTAIQSKTSYMFERNSGLVQNCDLLAFVVLSCLWGCTCDGFELVPFSFFYIIFYAWRHSFYFRIWIPKIAVGQLVWKTCTCQLSVFVHNWGFAVKQLQTFVLAVALCN